MHSAPRDSPDADRDPAPFYRSLDTRRLVAALGLTAAGFAALSSSLVGTEAPLWQSALVSGSSLAAFAVAGALATGPDLPRALGLWGRPIDSGPPAVGLRAWEVALVVAGMIGASHLADSLIQLHSQFETSTIPQVAQRMAEEAGGTDARPLFALLVGSALAAAVGEELFFRGWMLRVLASAWGRGAALTITSVAFGVVHGDFLHSLATAVLGVYLGVAALRSGAVWVPFLCHFANNSFAVLANSSWMPTAWLDLRWSAVVLVSALAVLAWPSRRVRGTHRSAPG